MKDKELRKLIGSMAKQRRLELKLTQPYVAEKMGVTAVSYTHLSIMAFYLPGKPEIKFVISWCYRDLFPICLLYTSRCV